MQAPTPASRARQDGTHICTAAEGGHGRTHDGGVAVLHVLIQAPAAWVLVVPISCPEPTYLTFEAPEFYDPFRFARWTGPGIAVFQRSAGAVRMSGHNVDVNPPPALLVIQKNMANSATRIPTNRRSTDLSNTRRNDIPGPAHRRSSGSRSSIPHSPTALSNTPLPVRAPTSSTQFSDAPNSSSGPRIAVRSSTLSLPQYRDRRLRIFCLREHTDEDPEFLVDVLKHVSNISGDKQLPRKGGRSIVLCVHVLNEKGEEDRVAAKVLEVNNSLTESLALAEWHILQKFNHKHIIATAGACKMISYDNDDEDVPRVNIGILLYPYAPYTLKDRIEKIARAEGARRVGMSKLMLKWFACLCHAVVYLHSEGSKHRDIKPENILVDNVNTVILADFDRAGAHYEDPRMLESQGPTPRTDRYAPACVFDETSPRGPERDINCLGFCFLEMATVILGETETKLVQHLHAKAKTKSPGIPPYREALADGSVESWLAHLKKTSHSRPELVPIDSFKRVTVEEFLGLILSMMRADSSQSHMLRPAWEILRQLCDPCEHCGPTLPQQVSSESQQQLAADRPSNKVPRRQSNGALAPPSSTTHSPLSGPSRFHADGTAMERRSTEDTMHLADSRQNQAPTSILSEETSDRLPSKSEESDDEVTSTPKLTVTRTVTGNGTITVPLQYHRNVVDDTDASERPLKRRCPAETLDRNRVPSQLDKINEVSVGPRAKASTSDSEMLRTSPAPQNSHPPSVDSQENPVTDDRALTPSGRKRSFRNFVDQINGSLVCLWGCDPRKRAALKLKSRVKQPFELTPPLIHITASVLTGNLYHIDSRSGSRLKGDLTFACQYSAKMRGFESDFRASTVTGDDSTICQMNPAHHDLCTWWRRMDL
ncbi:uncharacterized protein MYCFIDRAFT_171461 [Pseudocercospora fijiensis CIRAD86]|uniref:Protein kinase domain-containing protein n=1 Tax=Pseudocercospora fijiensis (strain CIRAD86) TaxID=383855 RepID=M3A382_PSEFD|nr:uncharacterized protein MYCFIDRAFT_171461 [Pseudocercospora fijiensis CIRAD86]EME85554.1 hypothetical protein MYCFIDRAFT_171461 [Pseudocercospora fijiensis CIRAD86]